MRTSGLARPGDDALVNRKLSDIKWAKYSRREPAAPKSDARLIGYSQIEFAEKILQSKDSDVPDARMQSYSNGLVLTASLAADEAGIAAIPMVLGEQRPNPIRLSEPLKQSMSELWMVRREDFRHSACIRAVFNALEEAAQAARVMFTGEK